MSSSSIVHIGKFLLYWTFCVGVPKRVGVKWPITRINCLAIRNVLETNSSSIHSRNSQLPDPRSQLPALKCGLLFCEAGERACSNKSFGRHGAGSRRERHSVGPRPIHGDRISSAKVPQVAKQQKVTATTIVGVTNSPSNREQIANEKRTHRTRTRARIRTRTRSKQIPALRSYVL